MDLSTIGLAVAKEAAKSDQGKALSKKLKISFDLFWRQTLRNYHNNVSGYLAEIKTLIYRHEPVPFYDVYIETSVSKTKQKSRAKPDLIQSKELFDTLNKDCRLVVSGIAGSGKSMLVKHLFLKYPMYRLDKTPIFLQLRQIESGVSLLAAIHKEVSTFEKKFSIDHLTLALEHGMACLLLDGFDEIDPESREQVESEILDLSKRYPKASVVVSGRPDDTFFSWPGYSVVQMAPLTQAQVIELAGKIDINQPKIAEFVGAVRGELFETHRQFMSNPLLVTMMILVFCEGNSIPDELHLFYERAYEVLSLQHDGLKDLYTRRFHSNLSPDDLRRLIEAFSFLTYPQSLYSIRQDLMVPLVNRSKEFLKIEANTQKVIKDLCESISILFKEAREYHFLHRSFQEYFVAYFLLHRVPDKAPENFLKLFTTLPSSHCLSLAFQMNKDFMVDKVLRPLVNEVYGEIRDLDPERDTRELIRVFFHTWVREQTSSRTSFGLNDYRLAPNKDQLHRSFGLLILIGYNYPAIGEFLKEPLRVNISLNLPDNTKKRSNITAQFVKDKDELVEFGRTIKQSVAELHSSLNTYRRSDMELLILR